MNIFKRAINAVIDENIAKYRQMECLSTQMNNLIGLSQKDMDEAANEDITINIPGYKIGARKFPWNGWRSILVVVPIQVVPGNVGYRNHDEEKLFPVGWRVIAKGTATTMLPPHDEIPKILQAIKENI